MFKKGEEIERKIKWKYHLKKHESDCVDGCNESALYEIKSCQLFLEHDNGDGYSGFHLGRFVIDLYNHLAIKEQAHEEKKISGVKYIFVVIVDHKRRFEKMVSWRYVDRLVDHNKTKCKIRIKDIFVEQ